jgi:DNA-directed RNA polymerase subunit RPC12/RpoP
VLVNKHGTQDDLLLAIRFLSRLWGGMYAPILTTEPSPPDSVTINRLAQVRPDYVYSIGIDGKAWKPFVDSACQPRGYRILDDAFLEELRRHHNEEHITAAHAVRFLESQLSTTPGRVRKTRLIGWNPESPLFPYAAALFGLPYERGTPPVPHEVLDYSREATFSELFRAQIDIIQRFEFDWLDLANHGLNIASFGGGSEPPTLVLVDRVVEDLALFWNQRIGGQAGLPHWFLPVPLGSAEDPGLAELLNEWITQFRRLDLRPNFLRIQSQSIPVTHLEVFADRLRARLDGSAIKHVDVWPATCRISTVIPFEREELVVVERSGQRATWQQPTSQLTGLFESGISWMVDLVQDHRTRRSPFELYLPASSTTYDVLNAPNPPTVSHSVVQTFGWGTDSINVRCKSGDGMVSHWLPTSREILEELLAAYGLQFTKDEKRSCYGPALKLFGGLSQASLAFSGKRGLILEALANQPASMDELLGRLKLGKGKIPELNRSKDLDILFYNLPATKRRVGRERFLRYWSRTLPSEDRLGALLEHWVSNRILRREWRIGPCAVCQGTFPETQLTITRPYHCPGCGSSIAIPQRAQVVYTPHPMLKLALDQGLRPVALTGRFLKNLTHQGFLWLPGLKYVQSGLSGDLDIVASCDGHLVLAECKDLENIPPDRVDWTEILTQVRAMSGIAKLSKASVIAFSSLLTDYPPSFVHDVEQLGGCDLTVLLLNKGDLDKGFREVPDRRFANPLFLTIGDVVKERFPEVPLPKFKEPRVVETSTFAWRFGTAELETPEGSLVLEPSDDSNQGKLDTK